MRDRMLEYLPSAHINIVPKRLSTQSKDKTSRHEYCSSSAMNAECIRRLSAVRENNDSVPNWCQSRSDHSPAECLLTRDSPNDEGHDPADDIPNAFNGCEGACVPRLDTVRACCELWSEDEAAADEDDGATAGERGVEGDGGSERHGAEFGIRGWFGGGVVGYQGRDFVELENHNIDVSPSVI